MPDPSPRRFLAAVLLAAGSCLCVLAQDPAAEALRPVVEAYAEAHPQVGLAIAATRGGAITWSAFHGPADRETGRPVDASTLFELGSISKVFTCMAVMQLRERGLVDLDRPYASYVPEFRVPSPFPTGAEAITVRMLMTHTSGLVTDDDPWETTHPARDFHRAVLEHVKETPLLSAPGRQWRYSSFGTSLLGVLVERVGGQPFPEYMDRRVLEPLGMAGASFDVRRQDPRRLSAGFHYNPAYDQIPMDEIRPGGSLRASVPEASRLLTFLARGGEAPVLGAASLDEMLRRQNPEDPAHPMGLGFQMKTQPGADGRPLTFVYHDGVARNRSLFVYVPQWRAGFLVALNDLEKADLFLWELKEAFLQAPAQP